MIMSQETVDYLNSLRYTGKILPAKYIEKHIIDHHQLMEDMDVNSLGENHYIRRAEDLDIKFSYEKSDKKSLEVKYTDDIIDICIKYENIDDIPSLRSNALLAIGITYETDEHMPDYSIGIVVVTILNILNKIKNFYEKVD